MPIATNANNMKNERKPIPEFKSEEEEFEFWSKADSSEYLDPQGWRRVDPPMVPKTVGLHDILLTPDLEREVQHLAKERKVDVQEMIRELLSAGLRQQRLQPGA